LPLKPEADTAEARQAKADAQALESRAAAEAAELRRLQEEGARRLAVQRMHEEQGLGALAKANRVILTLDQFHHERRDASALLKAVDASNVRMVQRGEHFCFTLKTGESVVIRRNRRRRDRDSDLTFQLRIGGPVIPAPSRLRRSAR
jgi:hypothetical protein